MSKYLLGFFCVIALLTACQSTNLGLVNGIKAPNIILEDRNGEFLDLQKIQNNRIVLIDFWASWCKPCRKQNHELVKLHKIYKDKKIGEADGFMILSVSLDNNKEKWEAAIEKDKLDWPYHVCDLKGFGSPCVDVYQLTQIPTSYLVDERGIIIGKDVTPNWMVYEMERRIKASQ